MAKRYAQGGLIRPIKKDDGRAVFVSRGQAVVPASLLERYGRRHIEFLNGGKVDVFTAEEVLAEYEDED